MLLTEYFVPAEMKNSEKMLKKFTTFQLYSSYWNL